MAKRNSEIERRTSYEKSSSAAENVPPKPVVVSVQGVQDLETLLAFEQDTGPQVKQSQCHPRPISILNAQFETKEFCRSRHF